MRFAVRVSDWPGGIAELTKMLADMGVRLSFQYPRAIIMRKPVFRVFDIARLEPACSATGTS